LSSDGLGLDVVEVLLAVADGNLVARLPASIVLLLLLVPVLLVPLRLVLSKLSKRPSDAFSARKATE
jgi:Mn2+/Fe2+ NRAMP family transporter